MTILLRIDLVLCLALYQTPQHPQTKFRGMYWYQHVCIHEFVHACSKKQEHGFFWKLEHSLLTIGAPGIFMIEFFFPSYRFFSIYGHSHFFKLKRAYLKNSCQRLYILCNTHLHDIVGQIGCSQFTEYTDANCITV